MKQILAAALALASVAIAQQPDLATIERRGAFSILSVHSFRPLDAIATTLESEFGIAVGAEDTSFQFRGGMLDISTEDPKVRTGTLVPARWGFHVQFAVKQDGSPRDVRELLTTIVAAANARSPFAYRLDSDGNAFSFVPTRTRDAQGRSIAVVPLLDRLITIPYGVRRLNESAWLMAQGLSKQTGLQVNCCQSIIAGYPWGMEEMAFAADGEPARRILKRLGLNHWHVRCDRSFCIIDMK